MSTAIMWFRQDLRCRDNPALSTACQNHEKLIPIYIRELNPSLPMGGAQKWWLHHSLMALKNDLHQANLDLNFRTADPLHVLKELIKEHSVDAVYWNRLYEPMHSARDKMIKSELRALGVKVISCNGSLLHEPWEVLNQSGHYFKVFTPYWRQCLRQLQARSLVHVMRWPANQAIQSEVLEHWNLLPKNPDWASEFSLHWQPGEQGAMAHLEYFIEHHLKGYMDGRNRPAKSGTSRLSPHLHFGEISPQQIWWSIQHAMQEPSCDLQSAQTYLAELGWREFSYQLLYHFPSLMDANFKSQFDDFPWQDNEKALQRWQQGLTGYPIVDAGMRELWRTGYMHNRVRMIVASFLIKDLMIDWRKGAAWFWDTLLDADLASNSASWQWVAGSGADAAPYYRIFNPVLQGEKFDPQGEYVRRWIPELQSVSNKWIHQPWLAPKMGFSSLNYPEPMVDHAIARQHALASYKQLSSGSSSDGKD